MSFPTSPLNGQLATVNNILYAYDGTYNTWTRVPGTTVLGGVSNTTGALIWNTANSAGTFANAAFAAANSGSSATSAFNQANAAASFANGAFTKANNALANTTGTFGGTLTVAGDFNVVGSSDFFGNTVFQNAKSDANIGMVQIIGNTTGTSRPASGNGVMLHITSSDGQKAEILQDCFGAGTYNLFLGRMARGTVASPSAVQSGDVLVKFGGNGYSTSGYTLPGGAYIQYVATENWTDTNKGAKIQFGVTPTGSNAVATSMELSDGTVTLNGLVNPSKGFIYTPRIVSGNSTTAVIDFSSDSIVKLQCNADCTLSFTNYTAGKVVEVWLTNTSGSQHVVTHGCSAINSSVGATTFNLGAAHTAYLRYACLGGDLANTYVAIVYQ